MTEYIEVTFRFLPHLFLIAAVFMAVRAKDDLRKIVYLLWAVLIILAAINDRVAL
jgi:formate/nitrite transporter FocA (FNT family)